MAFESLFGGGGEVMAGTGDISTSDNSGFDFGGLFEDPNFIRGLGETGASISSGEPIGTSVGNFASNLTRRRQLQKGARESKQGQQSFQEKLLSLLGKGDLLSAKDQNDAFDSMNLDGDGNVTLSMKNTPQKQGLSRQQPLESVRRPAAGGDDLPDFSNQPGEGGFDFAGLDAEDIGMLLKAEQQFGQLDQNQMKMILNEKARRSTAIATSKNRASTLAELAANRKEKIRQFDTKQTLEKSKFGLDENKFSLSENRLKLSQLKEKNQEEMNPQELERHNLEMDNIQSQIDTRSAGLTDGGTTPSQQATIDKNNADLARKEAELGIKFDDIEKDEIASVQPSYIDSKGETQKVPFEEREANANQINNRVNSKVFYHIQQPVVTGWGDGKADQPGTVTPVFLPKHPKTGKQITSQDVIDTAKANKISPDEVLRQWGLIR